MTIIARCLMCRSIIRKVNPPDISDNQKSVTEEHLNDMTRETHEMAEAGFLKLWCNRCNCRVEFDTERVKD